MASDRPDSLPSVAQKTMSEWAGLNQVVAIALGGSRGSSSQDAQSDYDLYVYAKGDIPLDLRRSLAPSEAEIDNRFWEPGDEWIDPQTGAHIDVMYRSPAWIQDQIDRVLVRHEPSIGYSTCFWYNVLHSQALHDPSGWYTNLQKRASVPYPEELRKAIFAKNMPILRRNVSSYRKQIELAIQRHDLVSRQHRVTALLASFFDIWFALERMPHPGEKRLLSKLPHEWAQRVEAVISSPAEDLLKRIDDLLAPLEARSAAEGLF